jgi:hypothetical protein
MFLSLLHTFDPYPIVKGHLNLPTAEHFSDVPHSIYLYMLYKTLSRVTRWGRLAWPHFEVIICHIIRG